MQNPFRYFNGIVTLREIGPIWTINHQAKYLKSLASTLAVLNLLEANGFKCELPAFFIWEGNTMYLTKPAVINVLAELAGRVREFSISFDYMSEEVVARTTGDQPTSSFVERFAAMGAPWFFGINNLGALAQEAGLSVSDAVTVADLHRTFWPGRPLDSIIYQHYALCTLRTA